MSLIVVHRMLQNLVFPPLNAMLIILIGLTIFYWRKRIGYGCIVVGLSLLYLQSIPLVAYFAHKSIELPPLTANELKASDAIVVLGGGVNNDDYEYSSGLALSEGTLIRLEYTAYLAKKDPQKLIVTSAGYSEAEIMKHTLIDTFDVDNPIITEGKSRNTDENAHFVANLLRAQHIQNVVVVTQAYHMRRAIMLFKKYGLNPVAGSTDYYADTTLNTILAIEPSAEAMRQIAQWGHEVLGYFLYK